ncbi:Dynein heavy chain 2, axonemal [Acipenser ruthenus]|uniref:Dynein heavy chain 2, axonemal n=1 Tax=Acipenser ruthenus TaxID=7906 RepID=A0A444UWS1_ACIRT|nr:Dynein heavy chain 2, axonemal [Acipenser ruthenus]
MTEIKSYGRPPVLVETVMQAVMILRGNEPTWAEAKRQLGESNFIKQLVHFDKDNISDRVLKKIGQYCTQPDFQPEIIGRVSSAAKSLCMWVRAMEVYGRIYRVVEPKRARLNGAMQQLAEKQRDLAEAQAKLREVGEKLELLKKHYDEKLTQKEELRLKSEDMEMKLDRAAKLIVEESFLEDINNILSSGEVPNLYKADEFEEVRDFICLPENRKGICDFIREPRVYEDLVDFKALKQFMETQLGDYNITPGVVPMSLVLFRDAIEHSQYQQLIH